MKVIIIGGDAAGMSAAMEIVRHAKGTAVTVLERGGIYSYGQCGLPYIVDGRISTTKELIARDVETFRNKYGIDARTFHEVESIHTANQLVRGYNLQTAERFELQYDKLVIATGASPMMPDWFGKALEGIHMVKTIPQMDRLMQHLKKVQHVTVIGAGYIGLELAETLKLAGKSVRIIQRNQQLMTPIDKKLADKIYEEALKQGIDVSLGEEVLGFEGRGRVENVRTQKATYKTEAVIVASGIRPNTDIIQGIAKLENGAIIVNEKMETSLPFIYAAGDCATHFHRIKRTDDYIALGTTANKQGRIAGRNIAGKQAIFKGIVGTSILKFFDIQIGMTGISEKEALKQGIETVCYAWEANHVAGYYPTAQPLFLRVVVEKDTRKLLGMQILGAAGVDKRIDVFATALYAGLTFEDYVDLDLAYSPPFNGVWDAVQQVAKRYYNN